jgi:Ca2+-dependent lipid-binding protein
MFSLAYLPTAERLTIVVMKARNLITLGGGSDKKSPPDAYVKVSLVGAKDGKKLKKKKTSTQKSTLNPVFNEEVVFTNLKKEQLGEVVIQFTVFHDSMTSREMLGYFSIGGESRGNAGIQWRDMLNGKKSIAWWHKLESTESLMDAATTTVGDPSSQNHMPFTAAQLRKMSSKNLAKTINLSSLKIKPLSNILSNSNKSPAAANLSD